MDRRVVLIFIVLLCIPIANAQLANSPWPMLHGSAQHGGLSPYDTSHVNGSLKWKFDAGYGFEASPVIGEDGTIYIATHGNNVHAVNPDGTEKWMFDAGEQVYDSIWDSTKGIQSTPAIDKDGTIYFTSFSNYLFALNPDGTEKWRFRLYTFSNIWNSPAIAPDGTIYIGSEQHPHGPGKAPVEIGATFYAINPDGTEKWSIEYMISGISSSTAIGKDGTIYSSGYESSNAEDDVGEGILYAYNSDGSVKWEFRFEKWQESSPVIAPNGIIYIGSKEGKVYAINPADGTERWNYQTGDGVSALPAIGADGTIYIGSWDYNMYALNPDGTLKWKILTGESFEGVSSSAAIGSDGTIYFGSNDYDIYAANPDGTLKWQYETRGGVVASPAIGSDGTVYFGSWDGYLYAFGHPDDAMEIEEEQPYSEDLEKVDKPVDEIYYVDLTPEQHEEPGKEGFFEAIIQFFKKLFGLSDAHDFESCIAAGNPAMESWPRQCRHGDRTFTERIEMSPTECEDRGGRVLNTLPNYECEANETNIGEVVGLLCPCVCCVSN